MRTIAHLSDLHFGAEDPLMAEALLDELAAVRPDLVAVSGDLTQRAREAQFAAAAAWLARLPFPLLVVPGNHDVPLYDVLRRFAAPLGRYRRHVSADLAPYFVDEEMAVLGLNTARAATFSSGRLSLEQMDEICRRFEPLPPHLFRVLVTHHPFLPPEARPGYRLVGRAALALQSLERCGAELLLSGHTHLGYTGDIRRHHVFVKRSILVAQAGTALSHRRRGEPNSYNLLVLEPPRLTVEVRAWDGARFAPLTPTRYRKAGDHWEREGAVPPVTPPAPAGSPPRGLRRLRSRSSRG